MRFKHIFKKTIIILFAIMVVICISNIVTAHRLHMDVEAQSYEVMEIVIEAYYGDGKAVKNGDVTVYRESGDVYISGNTNSEGKFYFSINSTIGNETMTIEVEQSGHKTTYDIEVSGNLEKITLKGGENAGSIPTYQGAIAGFGYLLGLAGIASLIIAWRMKSDLKSEKTKIESKDNKK
jgi:nickel transport protein